jgi:hypothetical protein
VRALCFVASLTIFLPAPARATDDVQRARELFDRGRAEFESSNFVDAARDFEQAYAASHRPALLWNVAQAYRRIYDMDHDLAALRRACFVYRSFVDQAQTPQERADAERELAVANELLAHAEAQEPAKPTPTAAPVAATTAPAVQTAAPAPARPRTWLWVAVAGAAAVVLGAVAIAIGVASSSSGAPSTMGGNYMPCFGACP